MAKTRTLALLFLIVASLITSIPVANSVAISSSIMSASSTSDGWAYGFGRNTTSASAYATTDEIYFGIESGVVFYRGFLYFDTSAIPDNATITGADIHFHIKTDMSLNDFNVTIQSGMPTYPHDPLVNGDYFTGYYDGACGGSNSTANIAGGQLHVTLNATGRSWISKTGTTKLALRAYNDTANINTAIEQFLIIYSREAGVLYPPLIYVTYTVQGFQVIIHAPYYENGNVANCWVKVNITRPYNSTFSFTMDGTTGAKTYIFNDTNKPTAVSWNVTTGYNRTRTIYIKDSFEEIYLSIPSPSEDYYLYLFTVIDFVGITNGYLEAWFNVAGEQRLAIRESLSVTNTVSMWLMFQHRYDFRIMCDQGSYTWANYLVSVQQEITFVLFAGSFPHIYSGLNSTVNALRMNATWIQINYTDPESSTYWVYIELQYFASSYSYVTRWSMNTTSNTVQANIYTANETEPYRVFIQASRNDGLVNYYFIIPTAQNASTNPWGVWVVFGVFAIQGNQIVGIFIVLIFLAIFSVANGLVGIFVAWLIATMLWWIHWLDIPSGLLALAGALIMMWAIAEYRERQRRGGLPA